MPGSRRRPREVPGSDPDSISIHLLEYMYHIGTLMTIRDIDLTEGR
jgi:hypothetical protein